MHEIPDESIDMILCDLPYGTTRNKFDCVIPFDALWVGYNRIIKPNGAICLFAQMPFAAALGNSNLKMLRYEWIWQKKQGTNYLNAKKMPMKLHENVLVFYKNLPTYNPQFTNGRPYCTRRGSDSTNFDKHGPVVTENTGYRYPVDVVKFNYDKDKLHPTQKPVAICEYLIKTYTNEGDTVLDNCMGSGTTGVACVNTGRNFIGIEKEEKFFKIAQKRIQGE